MAPSFLSFPPELRNEIYPYFFNGERYIPLSYRYHYPNANKCGSGNRKSGSGPTPKNELLYFVRPSSKSTRYSAILQTCSQIYHEIRHLLYSRAIFECFIVCLFERSFPGFNARRLLNAHSFSKQTLRNIQHLEFCVDLGDWSDSGRPVEIIVDVLKDTCTLKRFTLVIERLLDKWRPASEKVWLRQILDIFKSVVASKSIEDVRIKLEGDETVPLPIRPMLCETKAIRASFQSVRTTALRPVTSSDHPSRHFQRLLPRSEKEKAFDDLQSPPDDCPVAGFLATENESYPRQSIIRCGMWKIKPRKTKVIRWQVRRVTEEPS